MEKIIGRIRYTTSKQRRAKKWHMQVSTDDLAPADLERMGGNKLEVLE
jgi:hypothetical protein